MNKVVYNKEDIEMVLKLLNQIEIKGLENIKYLTVAADKLRNDGKLKEEKADGSVNDL